MTALWAERKALFALWRKTIPYNAKHSDSEGVPETPLRCARCGCSIFSDKIICRDCGFSMRFFDRSQRKNRWQTGGDEPCFQEYAFDPMLNNRPPAVSDTDGLSDIEGRKGRALRRRPQVTIDAFARLLASQRGGLERLTDEKELRRAAYTMWLLVDHRIQCKDVAAILGESVNTVESRVRRAADALDELKAENRPLKEIHPVSAVLLSMRYREAFEKVCPQYRGENSRLLTKLVSDACAKS